MDSILWITVLFHLFQDLQLFCFSCLIALARITGILLITSQDSGYTSLILGSKVIINEISSLNICWEHGRGTLYHTEKVPFCTNFAVNFYHELAVAFIKCLFFIWSEDKERKKKEGKKRREGWEEGKEIIRKGENKERHTGHIFS